MNKKIKPILKKVMASARYFKTKKKLICGIAFGMKANPMTFICV